MRTVLFTLLMVACCASLKAQTALDSIQLYGYPVSKGIIYKYDPREDFSQACANSLNIVSVVTPADSVFHFEDGRVSSVFTIDGNYGIIVENPKGESITYSNLRKVSLKKGDRVIRGMCLGTTAQCEFSASGLNQVDILILKNIKALPYKKTIEYIRSNMSLRKNYTL